MKKIIFIITLLFCGFETRAQNDLNTDTIRVKVYFRQGYSTLEPSFRDNGVRLDAFTRRVAELQRDPMYRIGAFRIVTFASPEGSSIRNKRLSDTRAARIADYLRRSTSLPDSLFEVDSRGVDWLELSRMVASSDMPYRDEVLDILHNTPEWIIKGGAVVDGRKRRLGMLRGGRAWWYMYEHFFPEMRSSDAHVICRIERLPVPVMPQRDTIVVEHRDTVEIIRRDTVVLRDTVIACDSVDPISKPFYMALKTNLLYDAALIPNLGAEFYLGRRWSLGGNWMYAGWRSERRHNYWRIYGGELEIRKYFGRRAVEKALAGHHLGLYGQMFTFDFEAGGTGYMGGKPGGTLWDKMNYAVGIEYGYSLPVGRRLNLDFVLGVGYWGGEYQKYDPIDNHYLWKETRQRHWVGPTKAEVSLVWLIGRGNYNEKGGKR